MRTPSGGSTPTRLVVASRASRLALTQTGLVIDALRAFHPELEVEILEVSTEGDRDQRPFAEIDGKGLFTSEVERAVVEGRADVAVHSSKDLTARLAEGCSIVCYPMRAERADVVVGGTGDSAEERLRSLGPGASVGTSSMRRRSLLAEMRPDLATVEFRGNLDTRLAKVADGVVDAAILAAAGLDRLGIAVDPASCLDPTWWVPAPGQGALAVEALTERDDLRDLFSSLDDPATRSELDAERAYGLRLEGGCSVPLGCSAVVSGSSLTVTGYLGAPDGRSVRETRDGDSSDATAIGSELAEAILGAGGEAILADIGPRDVPVVEEP